MPEFIRVRFKDSGTKQTIAKPPAIDKSAYEVLDEDATDSNGRALPPEFPAKKPAAKKTASKRAPAKKTASKRAPAKKTASKRAPAKKTASRRAPRKKPVDDKSGQQAATTKES